MERSAQRVTETATRVPRAVTRRRQEVSSASIGLARYSSTCSSRRSCAPPSRASAVAVACAKGLVRAPSTTGTAVQASPAGPGGAGVVRGVALPGAGGADADDVPDRPGGHQPADVRERMRPEALEADLAGASGGRDPAGELVEAGEGGCGRLLQQHVRAGGRGGQRELGMGVDRGADDRHLRPDRVEQRVEPGEDRDVADEVALAGPGRAGVAHPGQAYRRSGPVQPVEVRQVPAAVPVQAHERDGRRYRCCHGDAS